MSRKGGPTTSTRRVDSIGDPPPGPSGMEAGRHHWRGWAYEPGFHLEGPANQPAVNQQEPRSKRDDLAGIRACSTATTADPGGPNAFRVRMRPLERSSATRSALSQPVPNERAYVDRSSFTRVIQSGIGVPSSDAPRRSRNACNPEMKPREAPTERLLWVIFNSEP
jgi:hypothetical protein